MSMAEAEAAESVEEEVADFVEEDFVEERAEEEWAEQEGAAERTAEREKGFEEDLDELDELQRLDDTGVGEPLLNGTGGLSQARTTDHLL